MKKYDEYIESYVPWIGDIPSSWNVARIKNILVERKEKNDPIKTDFILSLTADKGVIPYSEKKASGNKSKEDVSLYKLTYPNDIVINSMNVVSGAVGLSKYFGAVSPVYYTMYIRSDDISIDFYNHIFQSYSFQRSLMGLGNGILVKYSEETDKINTVRLRIPVDKLNNVLLPVPSLKEQVSIAKFLDDRTSSIDKIIDDKKKLIEKLKEYRQAIINEAVTKGLDKNCSMKDTGVDWIGEIPKDWDIKRLKNIGIFTRGSGIKKDDVNNEGIPCVRYGEIYTKYNHAFIETTSFVSEDIAKNCLQVSLDDILITLTGETKEDIGKAIVYLGDGRLVAGGDLAVLKCTNNNPSYVTYFLNAEISKLQKENLAVGEIIVHIGTANLQKIIIPLPDKNLQDKIVLFLDKKTSRIEATISNINVQITNLQEYKKSIISEAVTGKVKIEEHISREAI